MLKERCFRAQSNGFIQRVIQIGYKNNCQLFCISIGGYFICASLAESRRAGRGVRANH